MASRAFPCNISFGPSPSWTKNVSKNSLLAAKAMVDALAGGVFATS